MDRPNMHRKNFYKECDEIDAECRLRMKDGEHVYREGDITEKLSNLMGRDLIQAAVEECLDLLNYTRAHIIKLRHIQSTFENDSAIQKVCPSGKPKVSTTSEVPTLTC
jgi:hypothetical protein